MSSIERSDWCGRVDAAIAAGRYLEDPGLYADHVARCVTCRAHVHGYAEFRACLDRARIEAGAAAEALGRDAGVVSRAFARYRVARQIRSAAFGLAALVAVGGGLWLLARPGADAPGHAAAADAAGERARALLAAVTRDGVVEPERLRSDPALLRRFEDALRDPAPAVARTALFVLAGAGVGPAGGSLQARIEAFRPALEAPVVVATAGSAARATADALETARVQMLSTLLDGALVEAAQGRETVAARTLLALAGDPAADVRAGALEALTEDPAFRPGAEIEALARTDPSAKVRGAAVDCLARRGGTEGPAKVLAMWRERRDDDVERMAHDAVRAAPGAGELARARAEDPTVPLVVALGWARTLWRIDRSRLDPLIARALASTDGDAVHALVGLAREAGWADLRPALQATWRAAAGAARRSVGALLVAWDGASGEPARCELAFEIVAARPTDAREAALHDVAMRHAAERLRAHPDPAIAARARALVGDGEGAK